MSVLVHLAERVKWFYDTQLIPSVYSLSFLWVSFGWSALICAICVCKLLSFYSFSNKRTHVCRSPCRNNPLDIYICQDEYTALRFDMALNIQLKRNEICFQLKCVREMSLWLMCTEDQDQPVYPCTFWERSSHPNFVCSIVIDTFATETVLVIYLKLVQCLKDRRLLVYLLVYTHQQSWLLCK